MPMKSDRQSLIEFSLLIGGAGLLLPDFKIDDDDEELYFWMLALETSRYLEPRSRVPKSSYWLHYVLANPKFDEKRFRAQLRMDKQSFVDVVEMLKGTCNIAQDYSFMNYERII